MNLYDIVENKLKSSHKNLALILFKIFALVNKRRAESILHITDILIAKNRNTSAISLLETEMKSNPKYPFLFQLAYIYGLENKLKEETDIYETIIKHQVLVGENVDHLVLNNIIQSYSEMNELNRAKEIIDTYVEKISPESINTPLFFNCGNIFFKLEQYRKAIEYYKRALDSDYCERASIYQNLGNSYREIKDYPNAKKYFTESIKLSKTHESEAKALYGLGCIQYDIGQIDKAFDYFIQSANKGHELSRSMIDEIKKMKRMNQI